MSAHPLNYAKCVSRIAPVLGDKEGHAENLLKRKSLSCHKGRFAIAPTVFAVDIVQSCQNGPASVDKCTRAGPPDTGILFLSNEVLKNILFLSNALLKRILFLA